MGAAMSREPAACYYWQDGEWRWEWGGQLWIWASMCQCCGLEESTGVAVARLVLQGLLIGRMAPADLSSAAAADEVAAVCALAAVDAPGDGNCLFHALATQDEEGCCGEELSLESEAFGQDGFEEVWLEEAEHLRGPAAECWGGAVAISAYSLLRQRRVFAHIKVAGSDIVEVQDSSHALVDADAPVAHLLYNGVDHYSALIAPTPWSRPGPQPPPPRYFARAIAEAAGTAAAAVCAEACVRSRAKGQGVDFAASRPRLRGWPRAAAARPARSGKAPAPPPGKDNAGAGAAGRCDGGSQQSLRDPAAQTSHPFRPLEDAVTELALKLRFQPTLPPGAEDVELKDGAVWPRAFCAFDGCGWEAANGLEADLAKHLEAEHAEDLESAAACFPGPRPPDALLSVYNEAVARRCRAGAPLAGCSLDRTALRSFAEATAQDSVEALVCFCCACVYTRVAELEGQSEIQWRRPLSRKPMGERLFFGKSAAAAARGISLERFLEKYDQLDVPGKKLSDSESFAAAWPWRRRAAVLPGGSPCVTTLICMSMEARFRSEACALDETAHMARHRFGARGNALSFPLVWVDVLKALQGEGDQAAALPRSGAELGQLVRVLLKTNKKGKTSVRGLGGETQQGICYFGVYLQRDTEIKGLIHQANEAAVNLILDMKRLGHPSFAGVDEEGVRLRAAALPADGVPPEVLKVVVQVDAGVDDAEDKLQPQKAATPCDGRQEDAAAAGATFAAQRARAVVAEGCAAEDANEAAVAALRKLRRDLEAEVEKRELDKLEVRAGNQLLDQFQPLWERKAGRLRQARSAPEGPALLLKQLRGSQPICDLPGLRPWQEQKTLKRKLPSGLARLDCRGCKLRKLEGAFQQDNSEASFRIQQRNGDHALGGCLRPLREKREAAAEVGLRRLVRLPNLRNFPASARTCAVEILVLRERFGVVERAAGRAAASADTLEVVHGGGAWWLGAVGGETCGGLAAPGRLQGVQPPRFARCQAPRRAKPMPSAGKAWTAERALLMTEHLAARAALLEQVLAEDYGFWIPRRGEDVVLRSAGSRKE
ncbi:unnamed protein product [Effrenium voratum]|uniref:OTU domain-containing protein n=1 Tax=Effrenium voratum TaxID=2562239 RepID=A0AA36IJD0_9DINO|nr:unnamed protein product [Effrenium voratum]